MTHTNTSVLARFGVADLALEFPELEVPVLTGPQCQGDVMIVPAKPKKGGQPLGWGVEVVRSEAGGNTHVLNGDGLWLPNGRASVNDLVQGWLTVPEGGEAFLVHTQEHSAIGVGPGSYEVRTQREFAGIWQRVAD